MRQASSIWAIGVAVLALSCGEPTGPDLLGDDWEYLGLSGQAVTSLADTKWGLFAGTVAGGVFRLDPGTGEWEALGLDHGRVEALLFVRGEPDRLFVGMVPAESTALESVIYVSQDSGRSWLPSDDGVGEGHALPGAFSLAQDPNVPTDLYCAMPSALLRSTDGGRSWSSIYEGANTGPGTPGTAESIAISPYGRVWVAGWDSVYAGYVRWSDDIGGSWLGKVAPQYSTRLPFFVVHPDSKDPDRAWVGGTSGLFMTEDGGKSWIRTIWLDRGSIRALAHYEDAIYAAGSKAYELESGYTASQLAIYLSTDDGRTWQSLATPDGASGAADMAIGRDGPLLVGTASGVWQFTRRR